MSFRERLHASGPAPDRAGAMMLYGQFAGSWSGTVIAYEPGGVRRESSCEVHFGWVLEGRAIQDVWIAPAFGTRAPGEPSRMFGTTLRVYDPEQEQWEITWIDPVRRRFNRMTGRPVGADIVQEYRDNGGARVQWMFTEITPGSFHWIARESADGGAEWRVTGEFYLRRQTVS